MKRLFKGQRPDYLLIFGLIGWLICLLKSIQGIDLTDTGLYLSSAQRFFADPHSIEYELSVWLPSFINALFLKVFPQSGLLQFNLFAATLYLGPILMMRKTLRDLGCDSLWTALFFFVGILLSYRMSLPLNYNSLCTFLIVSAFYFIVQIVKDRQNSKKYYAAIILLSLMPFCRINAILLLGLFPILWYFGKTPFTEIKKHILASLAVALVIFGIMGIIGHLDVYKNSLLSLLDKSQSAGSDYSGSSLASMIIKDFSNGLGGAFHKGIFKIQDQRTLLISLSAFCFVSLFILAFKFRGRADRNRFSTCILLLVMMPLYTFGSNTGLVCSSQLLIITLPLCAAFFEFKNSFTKVHYLGKALTFCCLFLALRFSWNYTYRDQWDRLNLANEIKIPRLEGIRSGAERALFLEETYKNILSQIQAESPVIFFGEMPLFYFITQSAPALGSSWPGLLAPEKIKQKLSQLSDSPTIVIQKISFTSNNWPLDVKDVSRKNFMQSREIILDFARKRQMTLSFEDSAFQMWVPCTTNCFAFSEPTY